jgi:hypothetical protein
LALIQKRLLNIFSKRETTKLPKATYRKRNRVSRNEPLTYAMLASLASRLKTGTT